MLLNLRSNVTIIGTEKNLLHKEWASPVEFGAGASPPVANDTVFTNFQINP